MKETSLTSTKRGGVTDTYAKILQAEKEMTDVEQEVYNL